MKTAVYILLFANLAFFAWAGWIDTPPRGSAAPSTAGLSKLVLATGVQAGARNPPATMRSNTDAARCVSVGPFNTPERTASAAVLLRERGFEPRQREERGETGDGYWVFVGGLRSSAEESRVLRTLEQAALYDARVMPGSADQGRRISVGLFRERVRAERRARLLRRLGLTPEIGERHVTSTVYWLDLNLAPNDSTFSAEGLMASEEIASRLEVRVCPAVQSSPASG